MLSRLPEHLGCGHGSAFIELRKAFAHGSPQGLLRLEQSQALGEHIAFGEKSPLGDELLEKLARLGERAEALPELDDPERVNDFETPARP